MTQDDKKILFKTLCALLPYKAKVHVEHDVFYDEREPYDTELNLSVLYNRCAGMEIKPYLRPLSSMTDEEKEECASIFNTSLFFFQFKVNEYGDIESTKEANDYLYYDCELMSKWIDWLNEHHFDYRGLIEKGLAIEIKNMQ